MNGSRCRLCGSSGPLSWRVSARHVAGLVVAIPAHGAACALVLAAVLAVTMPGYVVRTERPSRETGAVRPVRTAGRS